MEPLGLDKVKLLKHVVLTPPSADGGDVWASQTGKVLATKSLF
jgi:hypothetical protein